MAFAKFEGSRFRIDGENHAILVNLTASIDENYHPTGVHRVRVCPLLLTSQV